MFTIEELLSKRNIRDAIQHLLRKKDGQGTDGIRVSEFEDYWKLNHEMIEKSIKEMTYEPGVVMNYEIVNGKGKKREVSSLNVTDRFLCRLLSQKLTRYLNPQFLDKSYAFQEGKGIVDAVMKAQAYINSGDMWVAAIDIKDYFDTINLERMTNICQEMITDEKVLHLLNSYLYCKVERNGIIEDKKMGIVQGNPISPVLSNWYLNELDIGMEVNQFHWIRFADDIHIYAKKRELAVKAYEIVSKKLKEFCLSVNEQKSGIFMALEKTLLGYDFYKYAGEIEVKKHQYKKIENYHNWHACSISKINQEYHIVQNGVLNKQDYALLFENDKKKYHIPIEAVEQINIYSDVTISSPVIRKLSENNIKVCIVDKYGNNVGTFVPELHYKDSKILLLQVKEYIEEKNRIEIARLLEIAGLHNMRVNLRYYNKKNKNILKRRIEILNRYIEEIKVVTSIDNMMLIEARARQEYYQSFNDIINNDNFLFLQRTKQPPKDAINAMISFGNTLLYNQVLQLLWNTSLNPQIGIIHATNRRHYSLNLDFADLFKPIIVDRIIFTLIHRLQIKKEHFQKTENSAILLTEEGKKIFVSAFHDKMNDKIVINKKEYTYRQLILNELRKYQTHLYENIPYKPYKYY